MVASHQRRWLVPFLVAVMAAALEEEPLNCTALGFIEENLKCSMCDRIEREIEDAELTAECRQCCRPDEPLPQFKRAELQICK